MRTRFPHWLLALAVAGGCALYSDVSVSPLIYDPANIDRGGDVQSMLRKADFNRAIEFASAIDEKPRHSAQELAALGEIEMMAGRYDDARRHLRAAIDLEPFRTVYAGIAWDLSQLEYMCNNYESSLDWAKVARDKGINVRPWHIDYLQALSNVNVYRFTSETRQRVPMRASRPDVPRIEVGLNGNHHVSAIVDSGAVLSIMSQSLASSLSVKLLGPFEGTFAGLLNEPINVKFGILDTLDIGHMQIANVPVAIMPDDKMKFLVSGKKEFKIDFLLGANLLKEFRIDLDFRRDLVTFERIPPGGHHPAPDQNLFIQQFRPAIRGTVNRHGWYMFIFDTGSEVTFLNERLLGNLPIQQFGPGIHNATLQGLGGSQKHGEKVENVEIGIDKWAGTFRTLPMYDAGEHEHATGIIGENFLRNFNVVIDFGRMRVDLTPIGAAALANRMEEPLPADQGKVPR